MWKQDKVRALPSCKDEIICRRCLTRSWVFCSASHLTPEDPRLGSVVIEVLTAVPIGVRRFHRVNVRPESDLECQESLTFKILCHFWKNPLWSTNQQGSGLIPAQHFVSFLDVISFKIPYHQFGSELSAKNSEYFLHFFVWTAQADNVDCAPSFTSTFFWLFYVFIISYQTDTLPAKERTCCARMKLRQNLLLSRTFCYGLWVQISKSGHPTFMLVILLHL